MTLFLLYPLNMNSYIEWKNSQML